MTASEAMAQGRGSGGRRPRVAAALACAAVLVALVVAGLVATHDDHGGATTLAVGSGDPVETTVTFEPSRPAVHCAGSYAGESTYRLFGEKCFVDGVLDARFALEPGGTWTFPNPSCGEVSGDNMFTGNGTFLLTTAVGDTIEGTSYTHVPLADDGGPIVLTITGGSRDHAGASGECTLDNHLREVRLGRQLQWGDSRCDIAWAGPADPPESTTTSSMPDSTTTSGSVPPTS